MNRLPLPPIFSLLLILVALTGCGTPTVPLMPTPVLYTEGGFSPLDHIPPDERWTPQLVYYATSRARTGGLQKIAYGNTPSPDITLGLTAIGFGDTHTAWADLAAASSTAQRKEPVPLSITGLIEAGVINQDATLDAAAGPDQAGWFLKDLDDHIEGARDKDILIYVHGAKVNFYNACAYTAQINHFAGRDMTALAFAWPSRQNLYAYTFGSDLQRGHEAAGSLATVIELLARETPARRIHILSWSAGGRVAMDTLVELRTRYPDQSLETLRERFRLGTAYFAAGDVPTDDFLDHLETIHGLVDRLVVTATDDDDALKMSTQFLGGGGRIGQTGNDLTEDEIALIESLERIELIDVSLGAQKRGFNMTGHRYWLNHPWASTEVLLALRTDLTARQRGLIQSDRSPVLWLIPKDYPTRLTELNGLQLRNR